VVRLQRRSLTTFEIGIKSGYLSRSMANNVGDGGIWTAQFGRTMDIPVYLEDRSKEGITNPGREKADNFPRDRALL